MATISNTPRPGYVWDSTDNVWYPIGVGGHSHPDYITQATAVNPTLIDAKGDIITATAADTPARLAVGANGETLVADSAATTGLRYSATPSASNPVLNSAFQVAQRGTSITVNNAGIYTLDRWFGTTPNNSTFSQQVTNDDTNLPSIQYCMRVQRTAAGTGTTTITAYQSFETVNSIPFAGKTVTLSFYARKGANYSAASDRLSVYLITGTGTDQNYSVGYTGAAYPVNDATATLTTTWQRFTFTGTLAAATNEITVWFGHVPVGTAGAADYFEITGVQLDVGSVALPFRTTAATIQGELAACQRYYYRAGGESSYQFFGWGVATNTTTASISILPSVKMRSVPSALDYGTLGVTHISGIATVSAAVFDITSSLITQLNITTTGLTAGQFIRLLANGSTSGFVALSAEL